MSAKRYTGITVRQFRSLACSSAWAEDNGQVGSDVGMDCYILDRTPGIRAHFFADPKPLHQAA